MEFWNKLGKYFSLFPKAQFSKQSKQTFFDQSQAKTQPLGGFCVLFSRALHWVPCSPTLSNPGNYFFGSNLTSILLRFCR